jgi:type II secretory pathway pseudopilin PulG
MFLNKKSINKYSGSNGFSMIEVIVAIFILELVGVGAFILIEQSLIGASLNQSQLTAYYLAQEGIELVRNIRDTNWLEEVDWDVGIVEGDYEIDYTYDQSFYYQCSSTPFASGCEYDGLHFLNLSSGLYKYGSAGTETKFKRRVTISSKTSDSLLISVLVSWKDRNKNYDVEAISILRDWYDQ